MINIKNLWIACVCILMYSFILSSCKSDEMDGTVFEIAPQDQVLHIEKGSSTVYVPINSTLSIDDWEVEYDASWITHGKKKNSLVLSFETNLDKTTRTTSLKVSSAVANYTLRINQYGEMDVELIVGNTKVSPTGGQASESGNYNKIDKTWDGLFFATDNTPPYFSLTSGTTFPVILEYFFPGEEVIDYAVYYPYAAKGAFGKLKVYTATADTPDYTLQGEYDFKESANVSTIPFSPGLKATKIKYEVLSGMNDVVSCDEMEFYTKVETTEDQLLKVFADITCTELKPGITDEDIDRLPAEYFKRMGHALKDNVYNEWEKDFRIREYKPYSYNTVWANKLHIKRFTDLDNPTGISVETGDELIVLVGDTYGQQIWLQCIGEERTDYVEDHEYVQTSASGDAYPVKQGINKLTMKNPGQLFVMYNVSDLSAANAQPIKIHIPLGSGKVNGFFDVGEHKTDEKYAELLSKATNKYFCVRGEKLMFYFHTDKLREVVKTKILPSLNFYTDFIEWEEELLGWGDIQPKQMNNHIFAISPEGAFMWSGDRRIAFAKSTLSKILNPDLLMDSKGSIWGQAHEMGHTFQEAINWPGCTESSNNLFSNYVTYKLGKFCSRGSENSKLADAYYRKEPWINLGNGGGDGELHMRMNWQLWIYFHRCGVMPDFFPKLFEELRNTPLTKSVPGMAQMQFAKAVSKVANMDMTEFFDRWGFFRPIDVAINDYGQSQYTVFQFQIDEAKKYMASFAKKPYAFCYIEDRKNGDLGIEDYKIGDVGHYTQFNENAQITTQPTYKLSGRNITISNGEKAVAFEVRKNSADGELIYFFNFFSYTLPISVETSEDIKFYAVQADGKRIEMIKG